MGKQSRKTKDRSRQIRAEYTILESKKSVQTPNHEEEKPWYRNAVIIAALVGGIATLIAVPLRSAFDDTGIINVPVPFPSLAIAEQRSPPETFNGRVIDDKTGNAIVGAIVAVQTSNNRFTRRTDSSGFFSFPVTPGVDQVTIQVEAEGYSRSNLRPSILAKSDLETIPLTPKPPAVKPRSSGKKIGRKEPTALTPEELEDEALKTLHSRTPNRNND